MRRILWNIYAWPVTLLLLATFLSITNRIGLLATLDMAMSLPSLVALHLHIWDKRVLSARFWKPYAFGFLVWELVYNIVLNPMDSGKQFDPVLLIVPVILLPLYIALFRYAFRKWSEEELPNQALGAARQGGRWGIERSMKHRIILIVFSIFVLGSVYVGGFIAGQMHEAKERLKFDLGYSLHVHSMIEKSDWDAVTRFSEIRIRGLTKSLLDRYYDPLGFYASLFERQITPDSIMQKRLPDIMAKANAFTSISTGVGSKSK